MSGAHPTARIWIFLTAVVALIATDSALAQKGSPGADWPYISGSTDGTKYSPLDLINASNVSKLKIA
jgi:glucose dehydrogenase